MSKWKITSLVIVLTMVVWTLAGCGGGTGSDTDTGSDADTGETYTNDAVHSDLSMADAVSAYLDKLDTEYGYQMAENLAYNEDLTDCALGWRSAGSDAEHKTADYLLDEMKAIGLQDVEKIGVPCDRFQFNGSKLTIADTDIDIMPASYQVNGTGKDGVQAEIVDVENGDEAGYEGKDVEGKIVLAGVDQRDEAWIDSYIREAYAHGAAALVTYGRAGYGQANSDTANVQDVCSPDLLPTCAISVNQANDIKQALEDGHNQADLMIDAEMGDGDGTTYNIVGKIPGKNHDQRILIAGHYDKYWYGFQDDCAAIALVYTIAKAMVDSGYTPENDIVFVAHGGEEWGTTNSQFDWTVGAWGMIEANEDWQGTTLGLINCELPAFETETNTVGIGAVPEFRTLADKLVTETGLVVTAGDVQFSKTAFDTTTMEDGVSYRWHGVPYFINMFEDETFIYSNYHTTADSKDTYDEDTFLTNLNWYGAMAMYIDGEPALELDTTQAAADLKANFNEELAEEAGVDTDAYQAAVDALQAAGEAQNAKIAEINENYEQAAADGDADTMASLREEGAALNKTSLAIFRAVQDQFLKDNDFQIYYGHSGIDENATLLKGVLAGLDDQVLWAEDEESGALDQAWQINAVHDYNYVIFSKEVGDDINQMYVNKNLTAEKDFWGYKKQIPLVKVGDMTYQLSRQDEADVDWDAAKAVYQKALDKTIQNIKKYSDKEIEAMGEVTAMF